MHFIEPILQQGSRIALDGVSKAIKIISINFDGLISSSLSRSIRPRCYVTIKQ